MHKCLTHGFHNFLQPGLRFRKIAGDLSLQAGSPKIIHDEETMIPVHLQFLVSNHRGMFKQRSDLEFVFQNFFCIRVLQRFRKEQFHRQRQGGASLSHFPDLSGFAGRHTVLKLVATDQVLVFAHESVLPARFWVTKASGDPKSPRRRS